MNLLAERIAAQLAEKLEGPIAVAGREVMSAKDAAEFLRMGRDGFNRT